MRNVLMAAAAALVLAGCAEEAPQQQQEQAAPAKPTPGLYEASFTVSELRSTDNTAPATELAQGGTATASGCVAADGTIDPSLFAEAEDACTASSSYVSNGRISMQLECRRPGQSGQVMQSVNGTYTADALEGEVSTTTYLSGAGDYAMTRSFTARRTGECPAGGAEAAGNSAANAAE